MKRMGGMEGLMGMLPGVQKIKKQIAEANIDDKMVDRQGAIISSMTKLERKKPDILAASRKRRIAAGAGVDVAEVNRLLKQHRQMADAFKMMSKGGGKGFAQMAQMLGGMGGGRRRRHGPPEEPGRRQDADALRKRDRRDGGQAARRATAASNCPAWAAVACPASTPSRNN